MDIWTPAYIALGSNLNDPIAQVKQAIRHLVNLSDTRVVLQSSLYQSAPLGPQDQPRFINAVVAMLTQLSAMDLLTALQSVEQGMGKLPPTQRWGARVIDLDILIYGEQRSDAVALQLPHPEMHKRNFVIVPLAEIAPSLVIPSHGLASSISMRLSMDGLIKLPQ